MRKLLILGASILQLPAIEKAKELGYYVGVADYNPNAIGVKFADQYYNVSTIDADGVTEIAKLFQPNGIMTLATDMPMRAVAAACKALGLPGISPETAIMATDKGKMIKAFERAGVEHPWYYIVNGEKIPEAIIDKLSFPCIMKPTDNAGSRGVVLCQNSNEIIQNLSYSYSQSRSKSIIIEEYLVGPEFSVEIMVINCIPHVIQITDKMTTGTPHFIEMGHSQPTRKTKTIQNQIKELACRAVEAIGIENGPAHVEIIMTKDGPVMVELGARLGGDCITTHLVPLSTGIDMVAATINLACGEKTDITPKFNKGSAIRYFKTKPGKIIEVSGVQEAKTIEGVKEVSIVRDVGEIVTDINSSSDRVGFVIAQAENAEKAIERCNCAMERIKFVIE